MRYTIKQLLEVKEFFRHYPDGQLHLRDQWPPATFKKEEWHRWLRDCLNTKINRREKPRGRKEDHDYQTELRRAARQLNHPRLIIDWLPQDLKERFAYRLRQNRQDL